jgi:hypothetical protein
MVGLPVLAAGVALVLAIGQSRLRDDYGRHLEQVAQQAAGAVDTYVHRRVLDVSLLGRTPELRQAAALASARSLDRAEVARLDAVWRSAGTPSREASALLATPASRYLADIVAHDLIYREALLTDRQGRIVAASGLTTDYDQSDEDWWKAAFDDGTRGRFSVTDVRWDDSARNYAIEIAVPVEAPEGGALAGILKVVADSREMLATVGAVQIGATSQATLLRENGSVVFTRRSVEPDTQFFAADAFKARSAELLQGGPQQGISFVADANGDSRIVGIAASQLARTYPNLAWFVAVSESQDELLAPVRGLAWYLLMTLALTAIAVLACALWFSMRLARPQVDTDIHLVEHAPVSHVGEADEAYGAR